MQRMVRRIGEELERAFCAINVPCSVKQIAIGGPTRDGSFAPYKPGFMFRIGGNSVSILLSGTDDEPDIDSCSFIGVGIDGRFLPDPDFSPPENETAIAEAVV